MNLQLLIVGAFWPILMLGTFGQDTNEALNLSDLVPTADRSGWEMVEEFTEYSPESLYEYLNGGAPQYLSFGFRKLVNVRYVYQGDDLRSVTLDLFEMESPLGAYGIYSSGRPRTASVRDWGAEGYRSGTIAAAWNRNVYVHGSADENDPALIEFLDRVIARAVGEVPGKAQMPWMVKVLPSADRIPFSDRYVGKDLLGHSFLPGGVLAEYSLGEGVKGLLFVSDLVTPPKAIEASDRLLEYESERGKVVGQLAIEGTTLHWVDDPGLGPGAFAQSDRFVLGLWGSPDTPAVRVLLSELIRNLQKD